MQVILSPVDSVANTYRALLPEGTPLEFQRILDLKVLCLKIWLILDTNNLPSLGIIQQLIVSAVVRHRAWRKQISKPFWKTSTSMPLPLLPPSNTQRWHRLSHHRSPPHPSRWHRLWQVQPFLLHQAWLPWQELWRTERTCSPEPRRLGGEQRPRGSRGSLHWRRRPKIGRTGRSGNSSTRKILLVVVFIVCDPLAVHIDIGNSLHTMYTSTVNLQCILYNNHFDRSIPYPILPRTGSSVVSKRSEIV